MDDDITTEHESYGVMEISRRECNVGKTLFGSSIKHQQTIVLKISRAEKKRSLNRHWYHGDNRPLVEIELSASQFTNAITTMNNVPGTPVTLLYVDGKRMEDCPDESQRELFEKEFKDKILDVSKVAKVLELMASKLLDMPGTIKKADKQKLSSMIRMLVQNVRSNLPFIQSSYNEAMDKTTTEAKAEVESFFQNMIMSLGIEALENKFKAPQIESDDEIIQIGDINGISEE